MCLCHSVRCESSPALPRLEGELSSALMPGMFSVKSLLSRAGESESWFSLMFNTSSLEHKASGQPCGLLEPVPFLTLAPIFFPLPCVPWGGTWCLVPPSQPFLLGSSFSELVAYWTLFRRSDVVTCGCVSLFRRAAFAVLCTSVSKQTCVWSQHINRICFQF